MQMYYDVSAGLKLQIHRASIDLNKKGLGYRKIRRVLKNDFNVDVPEPTISQWIYYGRVPGHNSVSWFKPKPMPDKNKLLKLYLKDKLSREELGKKFGVTNVTVKKWIEFYGESTRNKQDAMNTPRVKLLLRTRRLIKPTKNIKKLTNEKSYILGVLCGDGHINKNFAQLEISNNDLEFMKEFLRCVYLAYHWKFNYHFREKKNTIVTYISPEYIVNDLLNISTFGVRKWRVPNIIKSTKKLSNVSYFLRGFYDSEGCVGRHEVIFTVVNKNGALDIIKLLNRFKINATFKNYNRKNIGDIYHVGIYGKENIKRFRDRVGFSMTRKQNKFINLYKDW